MDLRVLHYADIETAFDRPERIGRLAGLIASRRDASTLVTGGGDNTAPGALSLATRGRQALDLFEELRPDVATLGNHDFDYGPAQTTALLDEAPQQWVAANVMHEGDPFGNADGVRPWVVLERGDTKLGIVGVLTEATPDITPAADGITVTDPVPAVEAAIAAVEDAHPDIEHRIVLSHLGDGDPALARAVDVDLILGGHRHDPRIERVDDTLLARPGSNASNVIEATYRDGAWTAKCRPTSDAPVMASVVERLRTRKRTAGLDAEVGMVETPISRARRAIFHGETRIGNLVADAYRWATDADVGLQNAGGIREGPPLSGSVTVGDLIGIVPFEETVSVGALTGRELETLFTQAAGVNLPFGRPEWWHAQVSGAEVVWDDDRAGLASLTVTGEPLDPDRTYTIATSDYLFTTPTEFPVLTPDHRVQQCGVQYEVLVEYVRSTPIDPSIEGRIRRVAANGDGPDSHPDSPP